VANPLTRSDFAGPGAKKKTLPEGNADEENETQIQQTRAAVTVGEVIEYPLRPNCQPKNSRNFQRREKHTQHCGKFRNNFFQLSACRTADVKRRCHRIVAVQGPAKTADETDTNE
jgi:hypothetical protein